MNVPARILERGERAARGACACSPADEGLCPPAMLHNALVRVPTEDLKRLLALLHRGELQCPLTPVEVTRCGFQIHMDALLGHLRGLSLEQHRRQHRPHARRIEPAQERMPRLV
jgi:hypothetical protein